MGKKRKKRNKEHKCSLFPYEMEEILSMQDAQERVGWSITAFDLPKTWRKASAGEGVIVAILDSGCDLDHPDLHNNIKVVPGANILNPRKPPHDDNQHGTHVAGIIAAEHNDFGMVGVAPKATIMPIKVLDRNGNGNLETVARGIRFAVEHGANMMCMSLGAPTKLQQLRKSIQWKQKLKCKQCNF